MSASRLSALSAKAIAAVRMIVGALLIYHGQEIFHKDIMDGYLTWDVFKIRGGQWLVFAGKLAELIAGVLLFIGLFTRFAAIICIDVFLFITFIVGDGRFWYQDQHPFLFVLLGMLFLFIGPGAWSVDGRNKNKIQNPN